MAQPGCGLSPPADSKMMQKNVKPPEMISTCFSSAGRCQASSDRRINRISGLEKISVVAKFFEASIKTDEYFRVKNITFSLFHDMAC